MVCFGVTDKELERARRCRLVAVGVEVGGRFGAEAADFLRLLARHRARSSPAALCPYSWWLQISGQLYNVAGCEYVYMRHHNPSGVTGMRGPGIYFTCESWTFRCLRRVLPGWLQTLGRWHVVFDVQQTLV